MYIENFLTEYDDSLTGELNIDPLGQLVIWSAWGQDIFHSRITSIANDVRQYTLNLLHHSVLRQLLAEENLQTAGEMKRRYPDKQAQEFRAACLIYLENIYIHTMLAAGEPQVTLTGVQGINKARLLWDKSDGNPRLRFGHRPECQLLTNQLQLGTNGRYKSPMINMQFFSRDYRYDLPGNKAVWQAAEHFIQGVPALTRLRKEALFHLRELMQAQKKSDLIVAFRDIPPKLRKACVQAFSHPRSVGRYSCDFWLQRSGLDRHAAGAIYQVLQEEYSNKHSLTPAEIFKRAEQVAGGMADMDPDELMTLRHIRLAEPFLSLIDLMFAGLRRQSSQTLAEFQTFWQQRGLSAQQLPQLAAQLQQNGPLLASLTGTPGRRFQQLLTLASAPQLEEQVRGLLDYHQELMNQRGKFPWLVLAGEQLSLQVPPTPVEEKRQNSDWVNHYYLPQFRHLLKDLRGEAA